jgi:four helix bundle protein
MARAVEDLKVWQRAQEFWIAVNALVDRSGFQRDRRLREQVKDAADSVVSNITEGFEQPTDRAFAKYLFTSKASTAEVRKRMQMACHHGYITQDEYAACNELGDEVARMTTGLIKYLIKSDRKDRGLGRPQKSTRPARTGKPSGLEARDPSADPTAEPTGDSTNESD